MLHSNMDIDTTITITAAEIEVIVRAHYEKAGFPPKEKINFQTTPDPDCEGMYPNYLLKGAQFKTVLHTK